MHKAPGGSGIKQNKKRPSVCPIFKPVLVGCCPLLISLSLWPKSLLALSANYQPKLCVIRGLSSPLRMCANCLGVLNTYRERHLNTCRNQALCASMYLHVCWDGWHLYWCVLCISAVFGLLILLVQRNWTHHLYAGMFQCPSLTTVSHRHSFNLAQIIKFNFTSEVVSWHDI